MRYAAAFAIIAVLALAAAGITAGVGYSASTMTTGNDLTAEYITVELGDAHTSTFVFDNIKCFGQTTVETDDVSGQIERKEYYRIPDQTVDSEIMKLTVEGSKAQTATMNVKVADLPEGAEIAIQFYEDSGKVAKVGNSLVLTTAGGDIVTTDGGIATAVQFDVGTEYWCVVTVSFQGTGPIAGQAPTELSFDIMFKATAVS